MEIIARKEGNTEMQNARLVALANFAMADASMAAWYTKYAYNDWRPVTAIRDAAGNDPKIPEGVAEELKG